MGANSAGRCLWAGAVPLLAVVAALVDWKLAIIAPVLWALHVVRYGRQVGMRRAALNLVGKFAELGGALAYLRRKLGGTPGHAITYK